MKTIIVSLSVVFAIVLVSAADGEFPHATVKVWDTAAAIPPALSLGLTPGESIDDSTGLTRHGTAYPTVVTLYANGTHPRGRSGISYWNPDGNIFAWYGKTVGFPSGVALNRNGPVSPGGPIDPGADGLAGTLDDRATSFGPGDVWVAGQQLELLYVHIAGTNMFRTYGMTNPLGDPGGKRAWGLTVDESTGNVFLAEPVEGRIARLDPVTSRTKVWLFGYNPAYVAFDATGHLYTTLSAGDAILRINPDDSGTMWRVPSVNGIAPSFRQVPHDTAPLGIPGDNSNVVEADADGNIWFLETNSNEIGRLSGGPDGVLGTGDDEICEFTAPGLLNPQQIATTGSGGGLQVYFTEGDGNAVSVVTPVEADQAAFPTRACTPVPAEPFPVIAFEAAASFFDERVEPLSTPIVPTVHEVPGLGSFPSGTTRTGDGRPIPPVLRFSPMPNPILSSDGTPIGDAGNGFPSGLTGVYAGNRIAGAYLKGNKHFEVTSGAVVAAPSLEDDPPPAAVAGRLTGGGNATTTDRKESTHGFVLHCDAAQEHDDVLQVSWVDGNRFQLTSVTTRACSDDPAIDSTGFDTHTGTGTGRANGAQATVEWTFTDGGKQGADGAWIAIRNSLGATVFEAGGTLKKGNHRAHGGKGED